PFCENGAEGLVRREGLPRSGPGAVAYEDTRPQPVLQPFSGRNLPIRARRASDGKSSTDWPFTRKRREGMSRYWVLCPELIYNEGEDARPSLKSWMWVAPAPHKKQGLLP